MIRLKSAEARHIEPGTILFEHGQPANRFYLFRSGRIMVGVPAIQGARVIDAPDSRLRENASMMVDARRPGIAWASRVAIRERVQDLLRSAPSRFARSGLIRRAAAAGTLSAGSMH